MAILKSNLAAVMALGGLVFVAPTALANTVRLDYTGTAYGYEAATVSPGPDNAQSARVSVGGFNMKVLPPDNSSQFDPGQSFTAWCVDINHWLADPFTYNVRGKSELASAFSISRVDNLQLLIGQRYNDVLSHHNSEYSAAFQLSIWEIMFETGNSYDLDNGGFKATNITNKDGGTQTPHDLAEQWLSMLTTAAITGQYKITYLQDPNGNVAPNSQNLITVSAVPLPGAGVLMLSALGLGGLMAKRRR